LTSAVMSRTALILCPATSYPRIADACRRRRSRAPCACWADAIVPLVAALNRAIESSVFPRDINFDLIDSIHTGIKIISYMYMAPLATWPEAGAFVRDAADRITQPPANTGNRDTLVDEFKTTMKAMGPDKVTATNLLNLFLNIALASVRRNTYSSASNRVNRRIDKVVEIFMNCGADPSAAGGLQYDRTTAFQKTIFMPKNSGMHQFLLRDALLRTMSGGKIFGKRVANEGDRKLLITLGEARTIARILTPVSLSVATLDLDAVLFFALKRLRDGLSGFTAINPVLLHIARLVSFDDPDISRQNAEHIKFLWDDVAKTVPGISTPTTRIDIDYWSNARDQLEYLATQLRKRLVFVSPSAYKRLKSPQLKPSDLDAYREIFARRLARAVELYRQRYDKPLVQKKKVITKQLTQWTTENYKHVQNARRQNTKTSVEKTYRNYSAARINANVGMYMKKYALRSPRLPVDMRNDAVDVLWRGMHGPQYTRLRCDGSVSSPGYVATTSSRSIATRFGKAQHGTTVRLQISDIPEGTPWVWFTETCEEQRRRGLKIRPCSEVDEREVLLPPGIIVTLPPKTRGEWEPHEKQRLRRAVVMARRLPRSIRTPRPKMTISGEVVKMTHGAVRVTIKANVTNFVTVEILTTTKRKSPSIFAMALSLNVVVAALDEWCRIRGIPVVDLPHWARGDITRELTSVLLTYVLVRRNVGGRIGFSNGPEKWDSLLTSDYVDAMYIPLEKTTTISPRPLTIVGSLRALKRRAG
jgi:hypothetical protein